MLRARGYDDGKASCVLPISEVGIKSCSGVVLTLSARPGVVVNYSTTHPSGGFEKYTWHPGLFLTTS